MVRRQKLFVSGFASASFVASALGFFISSSHVPIADAQTRPPASNGGSASRYEKTVAREWMWRLWERDTLSSNDVAAEFRVDVLFGQVKTKTGALYWVIDKVEATKLVCRGLAGAITHAKSEIRVVEGYQQVTLNIEISFNTGKAARVSRSGLKAGINFETMKAALETTGRFEQEWAIQEELLGAEMTVRRAFTFRTNNGFIEGKLDSQAGDPSQDALDSLPRIDGVLSGPWDMQRLRIEHTDKSLLGIIAPEFR